ncbi:Cell division cycle protein-like protein [Emericellopsis cladophorae]|uniref:Cell division cycle protein-like protein n=1 Tax=Emericellopsis cladophorae TaxID=2686198 RepID=A0A9P9XVX7_9HYPO|nr:Cell division cycle protein-like protein [Emericellopsis cladophorae]KAI6778809.1 Cell division cycle protein-like protein [Emericellopsis cladophorae]
MPHLSTTVDAANTGTEDAEQLNFPPISKDHILNCSYDSWFLGYKSSCLRSRIISLPPAVVSYLQEDGIILADDEAEQHPEEEWHSEGAKGSRVEEVYSSDEEDEPEIDSRPPNERFPETHRLIKETIAELGGAVVPKLNWSSPKDAKWVNPHQNTLRCTTPSDIYLLLKSSSFVSHDLNHAFDHCDDTPAKQPFAPVLVLRPFFNPHNALEFRCFVKHRALIGITQRDLNHYDFLADLRPNLTRKIKHFFESVLRFTFPDSCFVFDVYVPENDDAEDGLGKVRLIDINPWSPSTDSLLFSWKELLDLEVKKPIYGSLSQDEASGSASEEDFTTSDETDEDGAAGQGQSFGQLEFRLIEKDDPAAYNFSAPQYSAHKLPKEVVDASAAGGSGLRDFLAQWRVLTEGKGDGMWEHAEASGGTST